MKNIQSSQEKTTRIKTSANISPNQIQSERQNFDVDMNEFNMLNAHHQDSINSSAGGGEGFFLTGVNVNGQANEKLDEDNVNPLLQESQLQIDNRLDLDEDSLIDNYEVISIIDSSRALSNDNCVIVSEKQQSLTHLTCNSQVTFRVDALISQYNQVEKIAQRYAKQFVDQQKTDKLMLNISDQHDTSNIGGFNISNFKMRYLNEFMGDIVKDYEQSFLGSFSKQLIQHMQSLNFFKSLDLYMSITKFEGDSGFSLVQGDDQEELQDDVVDDYQEFQIPMTQVRQSKVRDVDAYKKQSAKKNTDKKRISSEKYLLMSQSPKNNRDMTQDYGDDDKTKKQLFSLEKKQQNQMLHQRLHSQGSLPEYKQITDMSEIYSAFTQANLRYRVLKRKLQDKTSIDATVIKQIDEIKDEIILIQFKLLNKETEKQMNSFNILNVPLSKMGDINLQNLHDILIRLKSGSNKSKDFIPYNKSIMSRILAPMLHKENITYLTHYTKKGILSHLNSPNHTGLANGLFLFLDKIFIERRFKKKKLNHNEALKILQKKFSKEVKEIYSIIGNFRDGVNSFETYTNQSAQTMQTLVNKVNTKTQSFTLFHQILHFLALKEDIEMNGGPLANSNFLSEEEIQKVIFDKQYLKFLRKKIRAELAGMPQSTNGNQGSNVKLTKLQQVQYECIKSELKDDYDKKITYLKNRLDKKAQRDPSLLLFSQLTQDEPKKTSTTPLAGAGFNKSFTSGGRNSSNQYNRPRFQQNARDKKFYQPLENVNDKDKFYEFYLKSAQKAIDIMRQQQAQNYEDQNNSQNQNVGIRNEYQNLTNIPKGLVGSDFQSQSSSVIEQSRQAYSQNNSHFIQNLGTGMRINNPIRAQSSKKEERRQPKSIRNADSELDINNNNSVSKQQPKLQPLFVRDHIYQDNTNALERIEERIKMSKLNETQYTQNAYSNLDRKTSASSHSRAALSSQQRKFKKVLSNNQTFQLKQKSTTDTASGIPQMAKAQTELTKVKEFMPLRAQGKLKAFNIYNEGAESGYQPQISELTQFRENQQFLKNQSNLQNLSSVLYEQKDMKRKPQTAQRQKRISQNHNNYVSNDLNRQRTNSLSKPNLLKKESSNMIEIERDQDPYNQKARQELTEDKSLLSQLYPNAQ